uniref:Uncharacterized protein n=1 Tax=Oryza barthii TaxID=65489 RepID=A0A0D3HDT1_9ORYZ
MEDAAAAAEEGSGRRGGGRRERRPTRDGRRRRRQGFQVEQLIHARQILNFMGGKLHISRSLMERWECQY